MKVIQSVISALCFALLGTLAHAQADQVSGRIVGVLEVRTEPSCPTTSASA